MAETKKVQQDVIVAAPDDAAIMLDKARGFWSKNGKVLTYAIIAIVVIVGGFLAYRALVSAPNEAKAAEAIWKAQQHLEKDSIALALNGDGLNSGFEKIAKNFGGTKSGNLAKYYAGLCFLKLSDFNKAVTYLKDFSTDSKPTQALAYRLLGDAYSELNKNEDAIDYYAKAGHYFTEDDGLSSESLFRAGLKSEITGKSEDAIKYYREIQREFPNTERGRQVDKYLARLGVLDSK